MPVITATEVTVYSNISASAATITSSGLIPIVQERINLICNSYFTTDIMTTGLCTFNNTARTITLSANTWAQYGFADGDEIYIHHSYRNDKYVMVTSFAGTVATLATGESVVDEMSSRTVLFSVVKWPVQVKRAAALMVAFDMDTRPNLTPGVVSYSLGPLSETYSSSGISQFGYPQDLIASLPPPELSML